jgi:hypothetical protein
MGVSFDFGSLGLALVFLFLCLNLLLQESFRNNRSLYHLGYLFHLLTSVLLALVSLLALEVRVVDGVIFLSALLEARG